MPIKCVKYKGMVIRAGAFEVLGTGRFVPVLSIGTDDASGGYASARSFNPPCPDDLFEDSEDALECAIEFGRAIIDKQVPGPNTPHH